MSPTSAFGDLLRQYRARKAGLSQTRLAELAGYDRAILARMAQGGKDLTGPSGRERVVRLIEVLADQGALTSQDEANTLLKAAHMSPLYDGQPVEAALKRTLTPSSDSEMAKPGEEVTPIRHNLPASLTRFVGREREMAEIQRLFLPLPYQGEGRGEGACALTRLLTLTGSGGCGKTRLAIEVATSAVGALQFRDGIWLIELASLSNPDLIADTAIAALCLPPSSSPAVERLTNFLRGKHLLFILDNCEHLIGACAKLVETVLRGCPDLRVLATSREALNVPGEVTWRVPSLANDEAVQLFADRAKLARPGFALTDRNAATVTDICARLDGIPLAIELAAARLRVLSEEEIVARLEDRFSLLTSGSRTALARHQTLRATIDWSYGLLTQTESSLLRRLSVFAGGWTFYAAETVHGRPGTVDLLTQLVNKSLVIVDEGAKLTRYHLLETIRQYAYEKLAEVEDLEPSFHAHFGYFARLAHEAAPRLRAADQRQWLDRLDSELDNLRAALDWAAHHPSEEVGMQMAIDLGMFWDHRAHTREGITWLRALILGRDDVGARWRMTGLFWAAALAAQTGDSAWEDWNDEARALAEQLRDEQMIIATMLRKTPRLKVSREQEIADLQEGVRLARRAGQTWWVAQGLYILGRRLRLRGENERAITVLTESLALRRQLGEIGFMCESLGELGLLAFQQGDSARACELLEEGVGLAASVDYPPMLAYWLMELAIVAMGQGNHPRAAAALREAFPIYQRLGDDDGPVRCLCVAARLAQFTGWPEVAVRLFAAVEDRRPHLPPLSFTFQEKCDEWLADLCAELDLVRFDKAWAAGRAMTRDQAVAYALQVGEVHEPDERIW